MFIIGLPYSGLRRAAEAEWVASTNSGLAMKAEECSFSDIVSFLELIYTAAGINKLLFTGEKRMAFIADINL